MAEGILIQVKGNIVQVDSKFYTVLDTKYVPKEINIPVTFSVQKENPTVITFIKKAEDAPVATKKPFKKFPPKAQTSTAEEVEVDIPVLPIPKFEKKTYGKSPEEQATIKAQAIMHATSRVLIGSGLTGDDLEVQVRRFYKVFKELVG